MLRTVRSKRHCWSVCVCWRLAWHRRCCHLLILFNTVLLHVWIFGSLTSVKRVQHQYRDRWTKRAESTANFPTVSRSGSICRSVMSDMYWWLLSATELPRCYNGWIQGQAPKTLASGAYGAKKGTGTAWHDRYAWLESKKNKIKWHATYGAKQATFVILVCLLTSGVAS